MLCPETGFSPFSIGLFFPLLFCWKKRHLRYCGHLFVGSSLEPLHVAAQAVSDIFLLTASREKLPERGLRQIASLTSRQDASEHALATDLSLPVTLRCKRILTFLRLLPFEVAISFSVAKLVCNRARVLRILTNGIAAKIFLYQAYDLRRSHKIKSIYALSLEHPFSASTFSAP